MSDSHQTWTLIVLCYNEEASLEKVVEKAVNVLEKISPEARQIIIVDDGSRDRSRELATGLAARYSDIQLVLHATNAGIGQALRSGYANARHENVCMIPADGQFDLNELIPFARVSPNAFVSFFRKTNTIYSGIRRLLSDINRILNAALLGVDLKDVNWVKIYKGAHLKKIPLVMTSSLVESEICAKLNCLGVEAIEVESVYQARSGGKSKGSSPKIVFLALKDLLRLVWTVQKFRRTIRNDS